MKYLSVCSGIEAATVAWHPLGWEAVAYSEIEPFPSAVLVHHYPDTPNLGDMTKYKEWDSGRIGSIDVLAGGTPCQSFSVAGLRQGLNDPRGNLMLTYLAIAERFKPRWIVWENVPGVLSSNRGRDFGTFLGALAKLGYGWAYRVLDAQWFGLAQRRRRVFVVGCLGDWQRAAKVLFECESVCRNPAPSREKGKGTATNVADCLRSGGAGGVPSSRGEHLVVGALCSDSHPGSYSGQDAYTGRLIATAFKPGIAGREGGESRFTNEVTGTLRKDMGDNQTAVAIAFHPTQDPISSENTSHALGTGSKSGSATAAVATSTAVRRLTPTECERLQGFPDDYTAIPWRRKAANQCPDGLRYKALGNSMAVPVMQWIGRRIAEEARDD
jgi:DNA (cytosine-5)-methyltransferase 1